MATTYTLPPQTHFGGRRGFMIGNSRMKPATKDIRSVEQEPRCIPSTGRCFRHPFRYLTWTPTTQLAARKFLSKDAPLGCGILISHYIIVKKKSERFTPRLSRELIYQKAHTYFWRFTCYITQTLSDGCTRKKKKLKLKGIHFLLRQAKWQGGITKIWQKFKIVFMRIGRPTMDQDSVFLNISSFTYAETRLHRRRVKWGHLVWGVNTVVNFDIASQVLGTQFMIEVFTASSRHKRQSESDRTRIGQKKNWPTGNRPITLAALIEFCKPQSARPGGIVNSLKFLKSPYQAFWQ